MSAATHGMRRDRQLALLEGMDRPVGPIPRSVVEGSNADLILAIAPLYLTGSVLDTTYGRGMWWRHFRPEPFAFHDLATDGVDFRSLPHADHSWDAVCFDPPYLPQGGVKGAAQRDRDFRSRFGLTTPRSQKETDALLIAGLGECARVARRWVLVKCCDFTNGRKFRLGHVVVLQEAERLGLRCHDLIVHVSGPGPGGNQIATVLRTRRAHSYLVVLAA